MCAILRFSAIQRNSQPVGLFPGYRSMLDNLTAHVLENAAKRRWRERAYSRFLQDWRRQVVLLRRQRAGEFGPPLGDPSCVFSAHSAWLRCAVHPQGPCQGCPHYAPVAPSKPEPPLGSLDGRV
ncbi:DUF6464 family protein [Thermostichus sp. MS-CIW-39]